VKTSAYQPRTYRRWIKDKDLVSFRAAVRETDLQVRASRNLKARTLKSIFRHRIPLEAYVQQYPFFLTTLQPYDTGSDAPPIAREMARTASIVGVGPMAAVAGAIAELVGNDLLVFSPEVIVENGGDIFLKISRPRLVGIYAGTSPFTGRIAIEIQPEQTPLGVCCSSGTVGHSLSFGTADAVIVLSPSTFLADAAATALCNRVKTADDIDRVLAISQNISGIAGVAIIKDDKLGAWGNIKIVSADVTQ
jgi:ApbE superfamily uncharacterized protein (UPF0280 family)